MPSMVSMLLCVLVQGFCLGFNSIAQKKSQQGRIDSLADSLVFTLFLASFQAIFYCMLPPYRLNLGAPAGFYGYTFLFAAGFYVQFGLFMAAIRLGPAVLTSTIRSLSMLVPIVLGLFIWGEALTWAKGIGVALFVFATFFMNKGEYSVGGEKKALSVKWLVTSMVMLLVCGLCGSITKHVMLRYADVQKTYLLLYNVIVVLLGLPIAVICRRKLLALLKDKRFLFFVACSAVCTAVGDFIYVTFVPYYDSAFYMPLISTASIVATMILSRLILKEKITGRALIAMGLCIVAVIILS